MADNFRDIPMTEEEAKDAKCRLRELVRLGITSEKNAEKASEKIDKKVKKDEHR